ncbi:hypothetical protein BLOT_009446 [Blomia tropicalis]|nr:hypothetical protein BLOT_009446 [Blomia tropicalis]
MSSSFRFVLFECVGEKLTAYGGLMSSLLTYCLIGDDEIENQRRLECGSEFDNCRLALVAV